MPGIVVFKRRWSVGSDDLVVPAAFLVILHAVWIIVLGVILGVVHFGDDCADTMREHVLGYIVILSVCLLVEGIIAFVSMRGSILDTSPRTSMQYLLYVRLAVFIGEIAWLVLGVVWVAQNYKSCPNSTPKRAILGVIICNWLVMLCVVISLWCTFDTAGRSWVKMKRYQESIKEREQRHGARHRSGSRRRNWRHRKAMRAYEESWDRRCKFLFCCVKKDRHSNSFTEVAKLFTEFFRDLDVVPSDVVAGLVLLRRHQRMRRKVIINQGSNDVYQFLSGVPIIPQTKFLHLQNPDVLADYKQVVHYMRYALAAYGWPMYMKMNTGTGLCKIMPELRCCCCCCCRTKSHHAILVEDNCCECNKGALLKLSGLKNLELVYVTYHVDIGETPFFVAIDHEMRTVVISIRGTLSLQDVLTDLKADAEQLPVEPVREDWLGHKGMVQAAVYIKKKIKDEMLLSQAFGRDLDRDTKSYELVLVGHSLGAGTASILAILLYNEYPNLHCYAYSPPGGLLSATTVEETKSFITSVVVGKDVVPRIGLHQLEAMRQDLINVIKISTEPKWKIIGGSMMCCCPDEKVVSEDSTVMIETQKLMKQEKESRSFTHPTDSQIALTTHTPLYPPGKIIHIVRNHPKTTRLCGSNEPVYQAVWADNIDFDEVLISPSMVQDHMPDKVIEALEKVMVNLGPAKPVRKLPESVRKAQLDQDSPDQDQEAVDSAFVETSFTHTTQSCPNRSSGAFSSVSNSPSWDYVTPLGAEPNANKDSAVEKAKPKVRPCNLELNTGDIDVEDDLMAGAPLASPETLSDISSVDSGSWKGSQKSGNGYHRITTGMPTMAPIQQSPLKQGKADGYFYFIPVPSPVDYAETPENEFTGLSSVSTAPLAQSTPFKDISRKEEDRGSQRPQRNPEFTSSREQSPERESLLTAEQVLNDNANVNSQDDCRIALDDETLGSCSLNSQPYVPHSPDSPDSCNNQLLYDSYKGHYSHSGRGYPHGAYMNDNVRDRQMTSEELEDTLTSVTSLDWDDRTAMTPNTMDSTDPDCVSPTDPDSDKPGQNNNIDKPFPPASESLHHHNSSPRVVTNGDVPSQPHLPEKSSNKSTKDKVSRVDDLILLEQLKNLGEESHV